jgi:hypothetical protein
MWTNKNRARYMTAASCDLTDAEWGHVEPLIPPAKRGGAQDWATAQYYLGSALSELGERESGTARLEEAVAAYRAALEE